MTILLTTHYLDEAERLCDRVAIMHEGRIAGIGTPERSRDPRSGAGGAPRRRRRRGVVAVPLERGIAGPDAFSIGTGITVPLHDRPASAAIAQIAAMNLPTIAISGRAPTLDDVFLRLTGDRLAA